MASQIASASRQTKAKAGVWAVGLAAVIGVGALTGAQLKQDSQKEEVCQH
jgi:type VI protein secretion system component VasF